MSSSKKTHIENQLFDIIHFVLSLGQYKYSISVYKRLEAVAHG